MTNNILLEMKNISKEFPGVKALDNVSLSVKSGTVHALMGENGAGKSTLMKCLFGIYKPDSGEITLDGKSISFSSSKQALEMGVAMVHQELNQALKRSVSDNLWLGRYPKSAGFIVSEKKMKAETRRLFELLDIKANPAEIMGRMSVADRQMVEIAKAVSYNSKIIVLDEPTSSLTEKEAKHLFSIIAMLKKRGCGIIYISHKMEEILQISDEITVMRDGRHIISAPASEFDMDKIIRYMVGRELEGRFPAKENSPGEELFRINELCGRYSHVKNASFSLKKGEILGLAGLAGAGRTQLMELIFGLSQKEKGEMYLHGKKINNKNPADAIKKGFALVTEERRASGIFGILDICENMTVSSLKRYLSAGLYLSEKKRRRVTKEMISAMSVKTPSLSTKIKLLSGGNQQKVIFGRWLLTFPEILMLDEPTRGIDVGAKYEIYKLINNLAREGKSVIISSGELPELMGICDRICVMSGGRIAGVLNAASTTQEEIMALAAKYV